LSQWNAIESRSSTLFSDFLSFPTLHDIFTRLGDGIAKYVGVAADQLIGDRSSDLFDIKWVGWVIFGHSGVEVDLKEKISKLFAHRFPVVKFDRLYKFVTLLEEIFEKRGMGLFAIPWATAR
jgi:hypothetical protein